MKTIRSIILILAVCTFGTPATAELLDDLGWQALPDKELDEQRGGFVTEDGITIALGIEKSVSIDGVLQYATTLNLADLTKLDFSPEFSWETFVAENSTSFQQDGVSWLVSDAGTLLLNHGLDTIIQTSMNGKLIQVDTIINAHIENMELYRQIGLMNLITDQLVNALR